MRVRLDRQQRGREQQPGGEQVRGDQHVHEHLLAHEHEEPRLEDQRETAQVDRGGCERMREHPGGRAAQQPRQATGGHDVEAAQREGDRLGEHEQQRGEHAHQQVRRHVGHGIHRAALRERADERGDREQQPRAPGEDAPGRPAPSGPPLAQGGPEVERRADREGQQQPDLPGAAVRVTGHRARGRDRASSAMPISSSRMAAPFHARS